MKQVPDPRVADLLQAGKIRVGMASARLANMAVNVTMRSSPFMRASMEFRCEPEANATRAIRKQDAYV